MHLLPVSVGRAPSIDVRARADQREYGVSERGHLDPTCRSDRQSGRSVTMPDPLSPPPTAAGLTTSLSRHDPIRSPPRHRPPPTRIQHPLEPLRLWQIEARTPTTRQPARPGGDDFGGRQQGNVECIWMCSAAIRSTRHQILAAVATGTTQTSATTSRSWATSTAVADTEGEWLVSARVGAGV